MRNYGEKIVPLYSPEPPALVVKVPVRVSTPLTVLTFLARIEVDTDPHA